MGARIFFYLIAASSLLALSCEDRLSSDCYIGHYAMQSYVRPTKASVSPSTRGGQPVLELSLHGTIIASEESNVELFKALAAQRNDYSERQFKVCGFDRPYGCVDGMRSMRVLWPRAQGDTVDLSPAFALNYLTCEDFVRRGYTPVNASVIETKLVPVHELTGEHLQWLLASSELLVWQMQPVDIPFEEWGALVVRIEMDDGSRLPCRCSY